MMKSTSFKAVCAVAFALAVMSLMSAQQLPAQQAASPPREVPAQSHPAADPTPAAPAGQAQAPLAAAPSGSDAAANPADGGSRSLKSTTAALRELSPWSMFLSADVLVKAVMIGLAFASLVTWTIFIAKMLELTVVQRKLRSALAKIADARSLAEAQFALGAKGSVLASFLAAAMREARLSAGISSEGRLQEGAASGLSGNVRAAGARGPPRHGAPPPPPAAPPP